MTLTTCKRCRRPYEVLGISRLCSGCLHELAEMARKSSAERIAREVALLWKMWSL